MATTDIAIQEDVMSLDSMEPEHRELAVTGILQQSRDWLARAEVATDPAREVSQFKAFIATVAETSKQLGLSKEIKQDAEVMVRRAERSLGVAIRKGQAEGAIEGKNAPVHRGNQYKSGDDVKVTVAKSSPSDFVSGKTELSNPHGTGIYAITDNVTDEEFEDALDQAQEENNVSRANVVRKIKERKTTEEKEDLWEEVQRLSDRRLTSDQINAKLGMYSDPSTLRRNAKNRGIVFPADKIARPSNFSTERVLDSLASEMNATAMAHPLMSFEDITAEEAEALLERLEPGLKALRKIINSLKEITS